MPPGPGSSSDLPPGYLAGDAKEARRRSERRKKRLGLAAGVLVMLGAVAATLVLTAKSNKKTTVADLAVGDCFVGDPNDVDKVDCTEAHQFELFAVAEPADPSAAFPGAEAARTEGGNACVMELVGYFGGTAETAAAAGLELEPVAPTESQWDAGETGTYCLAKDAEGGALERSIKGEGAAG
jgi:hypothetical protein